MRIHFFSHDVTFTGGRLVLMRHAQALHDRGHDVTIWVPNAGTIDWIDLDVPIRDLSETGFEGLPRAHICLFDRRRFARPLCALQRGVPVHFCQGFEGVDVEVRQRRLQARPDGWLRWSERWHLHRRRRDIDRDYSLPTVKIVVQRHLQQLLAERYGGPVHLVPNGLPRGVFLPGNALPTGGRILIVGPTDVRCKRVGDALEAVRRLKNQRVDITLVRVAQHPMRECERRLGVTDEYHTLLGPTELAKQYRRASVLLFPSDETEGFGLPMLEAMACGTPVIASATSAARAFAARDDYALFAPVGRPDVLAQRLVQLLDDRALQVGLRERGLAVASGYREQHSHDAMEDTLHEIAKYRGRLRSKTEAEITSRSPISEEPCAAIADHAPSLPSLLG